MNYNKLPRSCASTNELVLNDLHGPDYEHRNNDEREQINKNKNLNDESFDFEFPNIRITRSQSKKIQIDMNNVKNDITKNSIRCSSFNDEIKNFNQPHKEIFPTEQNFSVSKKKKNHGQRNECTLLANKDNGNNSSTTNTNEKINNKTINTSMAKNALAININKDNNTINNININKDENTLTGSKSKNIYVLTSNNYKTKNTITTNPFTCKRTLNKKTKTQSKKNKTTNKQKKKCALITNDQKNLMSSKLNKNTLKLTNQNALETKSNSIILTPTVTSTSSTESCVNKLIGIKDDTSNNCNNSDNYDTDHHNEDFNNVVNDVNMVHDNMIQNYYCKDNGPTFLDKLADPLKGQEELESILLSKAFDLIIRLHTDTKFNIQIVKNRINYFNLKCDVLEFQMKNFIESTKCDRNTRHFSIENQNQMDTTLCKNIEVGENKNNAGTNKKGSSLRATTPLDSHNALCMLGRPKVKILTVEKDAQLSTLKSNRIKSSVWKSPKGQAAVPKNDPNMSLCGHVIFPVAIKPKTKTKCVSRVKISNVK